MGASEQPRLWLARHGRTAYNDEGRFQGWAPVPLDDEGREQARALAEEVAALEPAILVSSTIARAAETAAIVAARVGLEPVPDERFAETDAGDWTHRSFEEVLAEDPEGFARFVALDMDWGFPGGERFVEQRDRVLDGLGAWRERAGAADGPVVVVCHANVIRLALGAAGAEVPDRPVNGSLVEL